MVLGTATYVKDQETSVQELERHVAALRFLIMQVKSGAGPSLGRKFSDTLPDPPPDLDGATLDDEAARIADWHARVRLISDRCAKYAEQVVREADARVKPDRADSSEQQEMLHSPLSVERLNAYPEQRPVFVLGTARSGTSASAKALMDGAGFVGWHEGHLFPYLPPMLRGLMRMWDTYLMFEQRAPTHLYALGQVDPYAFLNQTIAVYNLVYAEAFGAKRGTRWLDKTPGPLALLAVPLLKHVYPNASFLYMHRHPLKVALSRLKKFPDESLELGLLDWSASMDNWHVVRESLPATSYLELGQADLSLETDRTVGRLAALLDLNRRQISGVRRYLANERPERTGSSADNDQILLEDLDWAPVVKSYVVAVCEDIALRWGYQIRRHAPAAAQDA
jgi:hypothetical protein